MTAQPLRIVQEWMQHVIRDAGEFANAAKDLPSPHSSTWQVDDVLTGSEQLSPSERLSIYAHAYTARLLECLQSEFPAVNQAVGDEAFAQFVSGYLQQRPSTSYTLTELGRRFPDYLQEARPLREGDESTPDFADFLIEIARLERTYSEVFDAPGPESLSSLATTVLSQLTPSRFAESRLLFHETVRLMTLQFPSHDYCSAVRKNCDLPLMQLCETPLLIFRKDYVVRRMVISPLQFLILRKLQDGATIGDVLNNIAAEREDAPDSLTEDIHSWFQQWVSLRLFHAIVFADEPPEI